MIRSSLTYLVLLLLILPLSAQNQVLIDSLWQEYHNANDTQKVNYLITISRAYIGTDNDEGLKLANRAYYMADSIGFKKGIPKAKGFIGLFYDFKGEHDTALYLYKKTAQEFEEVGNLLWASYSYRNVGIEYQDRGNYVLALDYMLKSLNVRKQLKDTGAILEANQSIAFLYDRLGNDDKAIELHRENLELASVANDSFYIAKSYQGIGIALDDLGRFQEALVYNTQALEVSQSMDRRRLFIQYEITTNKANIGNNYIHLEDFPSALKFTLEAYKEDSLNNQPDGLVQKAINLGFIYTKLGKFEQSKRFLDEGYVLANELQIVQRLQEIYNSYYLYYSAQRDYEAATRWLEKYANLRDSTFTNTMTQQFAEMSAEFDLVQKEREITEKELAISEKEVVIKQNRISIIVLVSLLVGGGLIGFWLFKRKQYKLKLHYEQEKSRLKSEQIQAVITSQEKERKRFAMDLHDDFGQLISVLKMNVSKLKGEPDELVKSGEILDSMYSSLKNIAFDLMPHTLFEKGIVNAIEELKDQLNASGKIQVGFQYFEIYDQISDDQKVAVYRIVQELMSNIIKYAKATKVNISITDLGHGFSLMIEDNGNGYDLADFRNGNGNGWKNIHSRLDLLNGEIEFDTELGRKNSTVSIEIPYKTQQQIARVS